VQHSSRSVWVVDDSNLDRARAARALAADYDVVALEDGSAALERVATGARPDVLVLDWVMPGISGIDVCRFMRTSARASAQSVAILLLTGYQRTEQVVEGLSAGANDYLSKPYADEELRARVAALIRSKELLERAEDAEKVVRLVLDGSPDALLVLNAKGHICYVNAEAERVLSARTDALLGRRPSEVVSGLSWTVPEPCAPEGMSLADVVVGQRIYAPVLRTLPGEGPVNTTIALRDVTESRRKEAERLDFYAVVAHDLRSPLSAIHLRTEAMLRGVRGALSDEVASDLNKVRSNVRSLVELINDFLEIARLDSPAGIVTREPIDLVPVMEAALDDLQPLVEAAGHDVRVSLPQEPAIVLGDAARLGQVLANLLSNAVKFTPKGGKLRASILAGPSHVEARVDDNGPGIDPELVPRLTERYVRGVAVNGSGTGLGLMIARRILEAHDTELCVDTEIDRGTSFWFRLPRL
jgi:signal transduction histidine kinase